MPTWDWGRICEVVGQVLSLPSLIEQAVRAAAIYRINACMTYVVTSIS